MHRLPRPSCARLARLAIAAALAAIPVRAQQFEALVGRGLPRDYFDTAALALADLDGDGHVDLVIGAVEIFPGLPLALRRGGPDGVFTSAPSGSMSAARCLPAKILCADLDGDGDLDVFVANRDGRQDVLLLNDGLGRFTDASPTGLPGLQDDSRAAVAADLDRDGDLDLVVATALGPDRLLLNDGRGVFTLGPGLPHRLGDDPTDIEAFDADGNGTIDLILTNARGQNRLWSGDGAGGFTDVSTARLPSDVDVSTAVVVADVDGDGAPDLLIGNRGTPDRLYRNDGAGRFATDPTWMPPVGGATVAAEALDADGDGDTDLVLARFGEANVLLLNDGTGSFRPAASPWPRREDHTNAVAVADVDGDGDPDLVFGNGCAVWAPGYDELLLNDGRGTFATATALAWPTRGADTEALAVADLDRDGALDVLVNSAAEVQVWRGDGYGGLSGPVTVATGVGPDFVLALACGDVDGDGDVDVVVGTSSSNVLLRNDGRGLLTAAPGALPTAGRETRAIALADVDGDGDLDLIEGNAGSSPQFAQQNRLLLNDGSGLFTDATATALPARADFTFGIAVADVDGDGDLDLLFANWSVAVPTSPRQPNRLLLNDGRGVFTDAPPGRLPLDDDPTAAAAFGDLDGDGDVDLVTANMGAPNRLYRNDGSGRFTEDPRALPRQFLPSRGLALGDYDADGDLDLVFANEDALNGVFRNDGPAVGFVDLSSSAWDGFRDTTAAIALADMDGDGDLDVLVGNRAGEADRLLFCLSRQLDVPLPVREGRSFVVEAYARPALPGSRAHLWFALSDAPPFLLPPLGGLRLDPRGLLDLGDAAIAPASGRADFVLRMPVSTGLVGLPLFFQSLVYAPIAPAGARLTNPVRVLVGG
jgi:hypothetical protein